VRWIVGVVLVCLLLLASSRPVLADEGRTPRTAHPAGLRLDPPGQAGRPTYVGPTNRLRLFFVVTGALLFGTLYGLTCANGPRVYCIPIAGPLIDLPHLLRTNKNADGSQDVAPSVLYLGEGLLAFGEGLGLAGIAAGVALPSQPLAAPVPMVGLNVLGLSLSGRF